MTREQRLTMADEAATKAARLAHSATISAQDSDSHIRDQAAPLAAAGSLWADVARAHAAIAAIAAE